METKNISGAGGGEAPQARAPVEASDTLHSRAMVTLVDLLGEGEIGGLVGGAKGIFINNTPLENANGTFNFTNILWDWRSGTQSQTIFEMDGYEGVESPHEIGVQVQIATPAVYTVASPITDAVRMIVTIPALFSQNVTDGDTNGTSVSYQFLVSKNGGAYVDSGLGVIDVKGKTRSTYQRSHLITLPKPATSWSIKMQRITADSASASLANDTMLTSCVEIVNTKLNYPNSALVACRLDSEQFSSMPSRSYLVDGLYIKVPRNYDAITRTYATTGAGTSNGGWDGTFHLAVSNNPAWVLYDLITTKRYGLGNYVTSGSLNKAALYTIGKYCDEMVDDGFGSTEPRFVLNTSFQSRAEAFKLISDISSVFRGMSYWNGGMIDFSQDAPTDPSMIYSAANVIDGAFEYSGSSRKDRSSVALVTWTDPADRYRQKPEYVEDADLIERFGVRQTEVIALGCTSRGQAHRVGKWILYSERYESETVTFRVGMQASELRVAHSRRPQLP